MTDIRAANTVEVSRETGLTVVVESGPMVLAIQPTGTLVRSAHGPGAPQYTSDEEVLQAADKVQLLTASGQSITLAPEIFLSVAGLLRALPSAVAAKWFKGDRSKVPPMLPTASGELAPMTSVFVTDDGAKHQLAHPNLLKVDGVVVALSQNTDGSLFVVGRAKEKGK